MTDSIEASEFQDEFPPAAQAGFDEMLAARWGEIEALKTAIAAEPVLDTRPSEPDRLAALEARLRNVEDWCAETELRVEALAVAMDCRLVALAGEVRPKAKPTRKPRAAKPAAKPQAELAQISPAGAEPQIPVALRAEILATLARAAEAGRPWSKSPQTAEQGRYATEILEETFGIDADSGRALLGLWESQGIVVYGETDRKRHTKGYALVGRGETGLIGETGMQTEAALGSAKLGEPGAHGQEGRPSIPGQREVRHISCPEPTRLDCGTEIPNLLAQSPAK